MTLSIPVQKVRDTLAATNKYRKRSVISKKQLQSLVGRLIHVAKCVAPARLFVSRLIEVLRGAEQWQIPINEEMKDDLTYGGW